MIKIKTLDLDGITLETQIAKVMEEVEELLSAVAKNDKENMLEEAWDIFQASVGLLHLKGITKEEIEEQYSKHLKKLENRPRNREFVGYDEYCDKYSTCKNCPMEFIENCKAFYTKLIEKGGEFHIKL